MSTNHGSFRIARKELGLFFGSPMAYLFLASFLAITLFVFFWVDAFFARNIADVRPMFEWMPLLLIFLSAALTMRMWSEEHRNGTIEQIMTLPNSPWSFVLGKFYACVILLAIALALTLPLPITVAWMADLDTGPVVAGYLATGLMGAAYLSVGLFISARTDNQIVSLILTVAICTLFYLTGSEALTNLLGYQAAEWLKSFSPAARFDAISRGVLDFRDLYFYLSFVLIFLSLNRFSLEQLRWANDGNKLHHNRWKWLTLLVAANAFIANLWLAPLHQLRADLTEGQLYSISEVTEQQLAQLQEPLLIRGYFSAKTHPLLSPLVPQLQDLMKEYQQLGGSKVRVEIIDPQKEPELEEEAASKFGIQPVPFQVADRYQAALVNSYFHVLVQYGDQHRVLVFRDLIEVKSELQGDLQVRLRNPEFDITQAIKRVVEDYQSEGDLWAAINKPVKFVGYISADSKLPESLKTFKSELTKALETAEQESGNKLSVELLEPEANGGQLAQTIEESYGFRPMVTSLMSSEKFYFYLTLQQEQTLVQLGLPEALTPEQFNLSLESGLKRFATGLMKKVALSAPLASGYGSSGPSFNQLRQQLSQTKVVEEANLSSGQIDDDADLLMVLAPDALDDKSLFAIDQFLMKGGTVVLNTSPYRSDYQGNRLAARSVDSGLTEWLKHHGIEIAEQFVMDPNNASFPVPIPRNVGGFTINEMAMLDYPYFADVRGDQLNQELPFTRTVPQVTVPWSSPILLDDNKLNELKVRKLITSSDEAWLSSDLNILPRMTRNGQSGFTPEGESQSHLLGVMLEGKFSSFFKGKPSPLIDTPADDQEDTDNKEAPKEQIESVVESSQDSARLILFASNELASDQVMSMLGSVDGANYQLPTQLLINTAEWSVEDSNLLSIRSGGHFNRTLPPLEESEQKWIEMANYLFGLFGLLLVYLIRRAINGARLKPYQQLIQQAKGA